MRKIFSYLYNILGFILILIFSVVIITENTDIVYRYYKDSIKSEFNDRTNLNVDFDSLSIKWNGLNPSIITQNLILRNQDDNLLKSEQLIIKIGLKLPSENIMFIVEELNLVGSDLSIQYDDNKVLINDYDIFSYLNSESRDNSMDKTKVRFSNSTINLYNIDSNVRYDLTNLNAVIFNDSESYNLFTTFNHDNDNQVFHLASRFKVDVNKNVSGSLYLKGENVDYVYTDLFSDEFILSLDNLKFTLWAEIKNSKLMKSNGNVFFDNAHLSNSRNNQLHKMNNGTFRFKYDDLYKSREFVIDKINMTIDDIGYEDNKVSFQLKNNHLNNIKIKKIFVQTAKGFHETLFSKKGNMMFLDNELSDEGHLENIMFINLQSILNIKYKFSYEGIGMKSSNGKYRVEGLSGKVIGSKNSGLFRISTSELSMSKDKAPLMDLDNFSGSVGFKVRPNSISIYSDDISINDEQILNVSGKVASDSYKLRFITNGNLELLKKQRFYQNNNSIKDFTIVSKYSLEYVLMKNKAKFKSYGVMEFDDLSLKNSTKNLFISSPKYKALLLDNLIFSRKSLVMFNNDKYEMEIDSGSNNGELFYKINASGLLSSDNIKAVINTQLLNSLEGESKSTISLKYTNSSENPSLVGELRTDMVGFRLNMFSPLKKNKKEKRKLFIQSDFMQDIKYFDISYDTYDMRISEGEEYTNVNIVSPFLNGNVRFPHIISDEKKILARLQYFDLNQFSGVADPKEYLPMKLQIKKVKIFDSFFSNFNLQTSTHTDGMSIDKISFANEYLTMDGQGKWIDNTAGQMTFFDGNFNSTNFGKSLDNFGYKNLIKKGKLSSRLIGQWPNSPETFSFKNFDGKILLDLKDGDFLQVTRETKVIGQLLGLFSIASLQKRLSLDFSDFFSSGLSFDEMTGEFTFDDSISNVKSLNLSGTFGEMTINGVSDLKKETHDHKLVYIPDLSSMSLISGTLLGGPIGAVASIFYDKVLKQIGIDTNELAAVEYSITGSWTDPEIILLEPFKQIEN